MTLRQFLRTDAVGDVMLLELSGSISSLADHSILNELEEIRQRRSQIGLNNLIVDLAQAPFFGSSLLELIRVLWNDISPHGGKLVLCNPSPVGREVLEVAKFNQIWPLVETRHQAFSLLANEGNLANWPQSIRDLVAKYDHGPVLLRESIAGLSSVQLRTPAAPGTWSVLQVVCHIADFELVYADRLKRVVAENQPTMFGGDPTVFAAKLAYHHRDIEEELNVITAIRRHVSRFLKTLTADDFERIGLHSVDGPLSLGVLLGRIAGHIPHHVKFVNGKRNQLFSRDSSSSSL